MKIKINSWIRAEKLGQLNEGDYFKFPTELGVYRKVGPIGDGHAIGIEKLLGDGTTASYTKDADTVVVRLGLAEMIFEEVN